jgi:hypothetical protein
MRLAGSKPCTQNLDQEGRMDAQVLYDVREVTGFVSGSDLHEIFREVCGEPSPSGHVKINPAKLPAHVRMELVKEVTLETIDDFFRDCAAGKSHPPTLIGFEVALIGTIGKPIRDVAHIIREAGEKL